MRRGNHNEFIVEDGKFIGVNLGWDFVAEHECGIKYLKQNFGLDESKIGVEARRVTELHRNFALIQRSGYTYLISTDFESPNKMNKKRLDGMIGAYWKTWRKDDPEVFLQSAWDDDSFGIAANGKEARKYLKELHKAFKANDVIITFGHDGGMHFGHAGLMLLIASKLPQDYIDSCAEADLDRRALIEASNKTGIRERLEKAGCRYFACSARWANDEKTEVHYWLNPMEQKIHNSGWMTVADLDDWIAGKGPVMKEMV